MVSSFLFVLSWNRLSVTCSLTSDKWAKRGWIQFCCGPLYFLSSSTIILVVRIMRFTILIKPTWNSLLPLWHQEVLCLWSLLHWQFWIFIYSCCIYLFFRCIVHMLCVLHQDFFEWVIIDKKNYITYLSAHGKADLDFRIFVSTLVLRISLKEVFNSVKKLVKMKHRNRLKCTGCSESKNLQKI